MNESSSPTVTVERKPGSTVTVKAEVPVERVEEAAERAFRRLVQKVAIPGFRPGKAPRALYERSYGSQHIYEEAARDLVEEIYRQAVDEHSLTPLDAPEVEISSLGPKQPLVFEATAPVRPEVTLGDYKDHSETVAPKTVTDEEVDRVVAGMREHHAELRPVDRPARTGDVLTVDADVAVANAERQPVGRDAHLEIGHEYAIPGLAEGLVGASSGDERTLELTFPEDYPDADVRGKKGTFTVTVKQVSEKLLPALDDEFAKTVGVADLATLRTTVRNELAHASFHEARDQAGEKALAHAVEGATVDVPAILVDEELDHMVSDLRERLGREGIAWEEFLLRSKKTEDEIRTDWREAATRRAKSLLVLDEIAKREEIGVTSDELAGELSMMPIDERDADAFRSPRVLAALARSIRNRKVVDRLVGLEGPNAERELLKQAGAVGEDGVPSGEEAATTASGLIVPGRERASKLIVPGS